MNFTNSGSINFRKLIKRIGPKGNKVAMQLEFGVFQDLNYQGMPEYSFFNFYKMKGYLMLIFGAPFLTTQDINS